MDYGIIICRVEAAHQPVRVPGIVGWEFGVRWSPTVGLPGEYKEKRNKIINIIKGNLKKTF